MLEHHIQKKIVYDLAFVDNQRFSELKPDDIESKLFDYHLKIVIRDGFVAKSDDGLYSLTPEGRRLGKRAFQKQIDTANRAESVLFLVIRRKVDNKWLLYKRLIHPLKGKVGFMHAYPEADLSLAESARAKCLEKTSIDCDFKVLGSGFFKTYEGENLESFVNFTLMVCEDAKGELSQNDPRAEYEWVQDPDFSNPNMIPNMKILTDYYQAGQSFFTEQTLRY